MKIRTLQLHNIASIEDATIDFDAGPLRETDIFLICGETGSGKTTILDGICLALYNDTPRITTAPGEAYNDTPGRVPGTNESNRISDVRQLMRRGTGEAWSKLSFTGNDGCDYTATWYVNRAHKKPTGQLQNVRRSLLSHNTGIELVKMDEIRSEIIRTVGLDFEQFCRTTMLAQGEFTRFLQSRSKEKSDILEKLTGTEIYSKIGRKIYETAKAREQELKTQQALIGNIHTLTEEEKDNLIAAIADKEAGIRTLTAICREQQDKVKWLTDETKLSDAHRQAVATLDELNATMSTPEFIATDKLVNEWFATTEVRAALDEKEKLTRQRQELDSRKSGLAKQLGKHMASAKALQKELEDDKRSLAAVAGYLSMTTRHRTMLDNAQGITASLKALDTAEQSVIAYQSRLPDIKNSINDIRRQSELLSEQLAQKQATADTIATDINSCNRDLAAIDAATLQAESERLNTILRDISEARALARQAGDAMTALNAAKEESAGIKRSIAETNSSLGKTAREKEKAKTELRTAEELYNLQRESVEDYARELRSHLKKGGTCPVCGQEIAEVYDESHFDSLLRPLLETLDSKRTKHESITQQLATAQAEVKTLKLALTGCDGRIQSLQDRLAQITRQLNDKCNRIGIQTVGTPADDEIDKTERQTKEKLRSINTRLNEWQTLSSHIAALNKRHNEALQAVQQANSAIAAADIRLAKAKSDLTHTEEYLDAARKKTEATKSQLRSAITIEGWETTWQTDPQALIRQIENDAAAYLEAIDKQRKLTAHSNELKQTTDLIGNIYRSIIQTFPDFAGITADDGGTIPADIASEWSIYHGKVQNVCALIEDNTKALAECERHIDRLFTDNTLPDISRLNELNAFTPTTINDKKSLVTAHRERLVRQKALCDSSLSALQEHATRRPALAEGETAETIAAGIRAAESEINETNKQIGSMTATLHEDETQHARLSEALAKLEEQRKIFLKWDRLRQWFGDSNGDKFRNIAQSYVLQELLDNANHYLSHFTKRYSLLCQPGSLTILLRDYYNGGTLRPTTTISGGEGFIISLSLALGLSSLGERGIDVGTLFIDEGFGTLSSSHLATVMDTLETLHRMGGRKIGIISHVEALRERIKTQIQVKYAGNAKSTVSVVTTG